MSALWKEVLIAAVVVLALAAGVFWLIKFFPKNPPPPAPVTKTVQPAPKREIIGHSVEGRDIESFTYGTGTTTLVFAGGMHGGYEWNAVLLAYQFMDFLDQNPTAVPANLSIAVIPDINPDGTFKVIGKEGRFTLDDVPTKEAMAGKPAGYGRFNDHNVDLNRNFACHWAPKSTWQNKIVSAGTAAFSEPEAQAVRDFALAVKPAAVIFWHSAADAVYASECDHGILPGTLDVMNAYAKAAGYPAVKKFTAYRITGDSEGWLASQNIPAVTVELKTHETTEWDKNLAGIQAVIGLFSQK